MFRLRTFYKVAATLFVTAMWFVSGTMNAQVISGDLVGTIFDSSGATVPGVSVTATNSATDVKTTTTANASGEYRFSNLEPGTYNVTASGAGFTTAELHGVAIQLNQTTTANLTLKVGAVSRP